MFTSKKEENAGVNNNMLIAIIVVLSIIIAVMGFFLGRMTTDSDKTVGVKNDTNIAKDYEDLTVTIITDKRDVKVPVDLIIEDLKKLPSVKNAEVIQKDFSEDGVREYLKETGLTKLPAFVFSTNNFDVSEDEQKTDGNGQLLPKLNTYLQKMDNGEFYLEVGSSFNPFIERSDRGFTKIAQEDFDEIIDNSYIDGDLDSKFVWIEYSDLECPYCAKFHKEGTMETVLSEYEGEFAVVFNHFPLDFHDNAQDAAEVLECLAEEKGSEAFYSLMRTSFANATSSLDTSKSSAKDFLIDEAVKLGADKSSLEACVSEGRYASKITNQMKKGSESFGVTGTPGNVLINTETLEYEVISGAYPADVFREVLEKLK